MFAQHLHIVHIVRSNNVHVLQSVRAGRDRADPCHRGPLVPRNRQGEDVRLLWRNRVLRPPHDTGRVGRGRLGLDLPRPTVRGRHDVHPVLQWRRAAARCRIRTPDCHRTGYVRHVGHLGLA